MSDELWAWLEQVRVEREEAQVALQDGDDRPMKLWALLYGHLLIVKVEELAGALEPFADQKRWDTCYNLDTGDIADDRHVFVTDESEPWSAVQSALRAPGGGES